MNLNELNYMICIAKHQNLTKAAAELYISQPTLSKYLQKLERELGAKLFCHMDNCYIPTYAGKRYLEYARKMMVTHQDWEKELTDLVTCTQGELNIAFPLMRSSCMIPSVLPAFHKKYPEIRVNFLEETHAIEEKLLLDDQIDFAIFNESSPHPKLVYETLYKEEILLVVPSSHPLSQANKKGNAGSIPYPEIDLKLFSDEKFILHFPEQTTGKIALELFSKYQISPPVPFHTRNTQAALLLAAEGLGVCFAPENYVKNMVFQNQPACFSIQGSRVYSTLSIAYRKGAYLPAYALDFIELVKI